MNVRSRHIRKIFQFDFTALMNVVQALLMLLLSEIHFSIQYHKNQQKKKEKKEKEKAYKWKQTPSLY